MGWEYGAPLADLKDLGRLLAHRLRLAHPRKATQPVPQYSTTIDGELMHFLHVHYLPATRPRPRLSPTLSTHASNRSPGGGNDVATH